jgi:hypothetical protein
LKHSDLVKSGQSFSITAAGEADQLRCPASFLRPPRAPGEEARGRWVREEEWSSRGPGLWAGETPARESNLEVVLLRKIGIDIHPGIGVRTSEGPDHEASTSRFDSESESNQESDCSAPIRYDVRLARGGMRWALAPALSGSHGPAAGAGAGDGTGADVPFHRLRIRCSGGDEPPTTTRSSGRRRSGPGGGWSGG